MATAAILESPSVAGAFLAEEPLYEIVNGEVVELPPMGIYAVCIASCLNSYLFIHAQENKNGRAVTEGLFILDPQRNLRRRPDVAFVSAAKWPLDRPLPESGDWEVVPDLAVEVVSPNDLFDDVMAKIHEYFQVGVRQVWIIVASQKEIYVYDSPTACRILSETDELDGGTLLPGFRLPVATVFKR